MIDPLTTTRPSMGTFRNVREAAAKPDGSLSFADTLSAAAQDGRKIDLYEPIKEERRTEKKAPYSYLAEDGIISYNGVNFVCDNEHERICLGDMSNEKKECIYIPLTEGGTLVVNRDNIGDLARAIGMFSPADVNRIMRAITQDAKCSQMKHEIDEMTNSIGDQEREEGEESA